jgi:hypothetical protein
MHRTGALVNTYSVLQRTNFHFHLYMVDANRLKRNFGYWLLSYHKEPFDILQQRPKQWLSTTSTATTTDDWCSMKRTMSGNCSWNLVPLQVRQCQFI